MLKVTSGVETGSSAMTDDQDDIVDMLRSAAESTWPNHLLTASAKEIERLREAVAKWRIIADDFATTHRHRLGLDGAWDKCNLAYEKAVRGE